MHKIDSFGAVTVQPTIKPVGGTVGFFTEGDPGAGIPATHVSGDWLNAVQNEITNVIAAAGIALDKTLSNQLLAAISSISQNNSSIANVAIANNSTTVITGLLFDSAQFRSAVIRFDLKRKTDTMNTRWIGDLTAYFDGTNWKLMGPSGVDESNSTPDGTPGVTFAINGVTGQISAVANNFTGTNYTGEISVKISRHKI